MSDAVIAVLAADRRRAIARDAAFTTPLRLRRRIAALVFACACALDAAAVRLDDDVGTLEV